MIYRYLDCGVLRNGFARVRCGECGHEYLLAFSCKRRHFCPSCHQKRVVEFAEWVCGEVLKGFPIVVILSSASPKSFDVISSTIVHSFRN
ncbi:MAG: transposase zinc-binding domain-containing protein [Thermodesulfobacteriota bacterium]|nr:transposase zinc-binding domain-containing protein [Thermodesulfobacteriota bacterium]